MHKMVKHIDHPLVARTHPPMYRIHKYWARKPHNVVAEYIRRYSKKGDIVLDPFVGSGVTAVEALKLKRKVIAVDLDPFALFLARMTAIPVDLKQLDAQFKKIENSCKVTINKLYETNCPKCGSKGLIRQVNWIVTSRKPYKEKPTDLWYSCEKCKSNSLWNKKIDKKDLPRIRSIDKRPVPYWVPEEKFIWNPRLNVDKGTKITDLFTHRNLIALSILLHHIEEVEDETVRNLLKLAFTSMLAQASRMIIQAPKGGTSSASWKVRGYWIPDKHRELNVWHYFENRYQLLYTGKEESNKLIPDYQEAETFGDLKGENNILFLNISALKLKGISSNSVDYVFTDPPYGDSVPYLEADYMWATWLRMKPNFEDEIIISDSPARQKNFEMYEKMLNAAFREVQRVLKPGRWMTVTFHNTNIKIWNAIIHAAVMADFNLEKIVYQPPAKRSSKASLHPYYSAVGDYYIRFRKPKYEKTIISSSEIDERHYERVVVEATKELIAKRGEPTAYQYILNGIIPILDKNGVLLKGTKDIRDVLKENLDKEFVLVEKKWWLKDVRKSKIDLVPLDERVEKAVINVLNREITVHFDDILQEIFIAFPNALTPETQKIKSILEEYATKAEKGLWRLKPEVAARERQHSKMIFFLAKIGEKMGYKIWIGSREQGDTYKGHKLSEYSEKELELADSLPKEQLDRIKEIDVLWLSEGVIRIEFEVENTTTITEAIVRGANIPSEYKPHRFIVIPEERENLISRKIQEPGLQELGISDWHFIFYRDLEDFYLEHKRRKGITLGDLLNLSSNPKYKSPKQASLGFSEEDG
ncbi:hypothetical protein CEE36_07440 [candidate division TA06 bacterium B3_TA06]|uniref:DNA methylase N-4/N-6 domain-containing protein n=1 Tax=candidate division TA06 bacterium B3_TA06 TaxID=2012487 RepID=A0A532V4E8_UNCT6|nr:MAG: hypothetical protein CEE36_07440 [candidate division TA06 bacterium B3_TA06]